ncbi:MAG: hypothetical protein MMC23_008507 [Stictis urceolatum]|nr:hypothetical protein [Stictis urceolata]
MSLSRSLGLSNVSPTSAAAGFLAWNWFYAYAVLSTRAMKSRLGIDHNVCPREDVTKYGEQAVRNGKITSAQLAKLKRNEAAHANTVEGFALFAVSEDPRSSILVETVAG